MISHVLFLHLFIYSKTNEWMHLFLERLKEILPSPFLEPVVSFYERPGDDLKFHIQLKAPGKNELAYFSTHPAGNTALVPHSVMFWCFA